LFTELIQYWLKQFSSHIQPLSGQFCDVIWILIELSLCLLHESFGKAWLTQLHNKGNNVQLESQQFLVSITILISVRKGSCFVNYSRQSCFGKLVRWITCGNVTTFRFFRFSHSCDDLIIDKDTFHVPRSTLLARVLRFWHSSSQQQ